MLLMVMVAMQGSASQAGLTREGASWASPPTPSFGHDPSSDLGRSVQVCDLIPLASKHHDILHLLG